MSAVRFRPRPPSISRKIEWHLLRCSVVASLRRGLATSRFASPSRLVSAIRFCVHLSLGFFCLGCFYLSLGFFWLVTYFVRNSLFGWLIARFRLQLAFFVRLSSGVLSAPTVHNEWSNVWLVVLILQFTFL